jgi:hypothetical protein
MDEESLTQQQTRRRLQQYAALFLSIILSATTALLESVYTTREPYHTSILTGEGWVMELLAGHPERIHCELGVHHFVFEALILDRREMGHDNSRRGVSLEEQLAIFLYASVTGLTIRHIGERFQRSNETISR